MPSWVTLLRNTNGKLGSSYATLTAEVKMMICKICTTVAQKCTVNSKSLILKSVSFGWCLLLEARNDDEETFQEDVELARKVKICQYTRTTKQLDPDLKINASSMFYRSFFLSKRWNRENGKNHFVGSLSRTWKCTFRGEKTVWKQSNRDRVNLFGIYLRRHMLSEIWFLTKY